MHWKKVLQLYRDNHKLLFAAALAVTRDCSAAEDALHEAVLSVAQSATTPENPKAYLLTAIRHAAQKNLRRSRADSQRGEWLAFDDGAAPEDREMLATLAAAIDNLPAATREAVVLHAIAGLTFREIGELTRESINTIASRYRRGLSTLRDHLDEDS
ncbi:MAG: sigma-70 family RNA polymerase sigma factor [Pseudomonadota bacterium]